MHQVASSSVIRNFVDNVECGEPDVASLDNVNPATGRVINRVLASRAADVEGAVSAARAAFPDWSGRSAVARGDLLFRLCQRIEDAGAAIAAIAAEETGKTRSDALGEVGAAVQCGRFFAGEGTRLFGRTMPSGTRGKYNATVRQPIGVAGLIIASNTPVANVAWKLFPALICGNSVVMKAAETSPGTALAIARLAAEAGLPPGVFNVVQGTGAEAGAALVAHPGTDVISFTGSTAVGRQIAEICARQLKKVSLELGGKNPFVVCADADLDRAVRWACLSIYSNAGQRCAAASRLLVQDTIYDQFRERLVAATSEVKVGVEEGDLCGPVISGAALSRILEAVDRAVAEGATVLIGGERAVSPALRDGFFMLPTLIEGVAHGHGISTTELFGPVGLLYRFKTYDDALRLANDSPYGLTACIHTRDVDRAMHFAHHVAAGVAVVNAGTYGSEAHMPFGGLRRSGNGTREPGTEALDVYSNLKDIYVVTETKHL